MKKINVVCRIANRLNKIFIGPILRVFFTRFGLSKKLKFLNTNSSSIGHLCLDVDVFLKESAIENFNFKGVLLASNSAVANEAIAKIWSNHPRLFVIKSRLLCFLFDYLRTYDDTSFDCSSYTAKLESPAKMYSIYKKCASSSPVIAWPSGLYTKGQILFSRVFPDADPNRFAVLHSRDSSFDLRTGNSNYFTAQHRNSDIASYSGILRFLNDKGIFVIRIGEYDAVTTSSNKLFHMIPALAKSEIDLLNAFMASECLLFLGSNSGASAMAAIWDCPIFTLNFLPYNGLRQYPPHSMTIPKLLMVDGSVLGAKKIFDMGFHRLNTDYQYKEKGIEIVNNRSEDCLADFEEFFCAFVEGDSNLKRKLQNSIERKNYSLCTVGSNYDKDAPGLIPRHFFRRYGVV